MSSTRSRRSLSSGSRQAPGAGIRAGRNRRRDRHARRPARAPPAAAARVHQPGLRALRDAPPGRGELAVGSGRPSHRGDLLRGRDGRCSRDRGAVRARQRARRHGRSGLRGLRGEWHAERGARGRRRERGEPPRRRSRTGGRARGRRARRSGPAGGSAGAGARRALRAERCGSEPRRTRDSSSCSGTRTAASAEACTRS